MQMIGMNIATDEYEIFYLRDVKSITYGTIKNEKRQVLIYVTPYGSFTPIVSLDDAEEAYRKYGFARFDKSYVVNKRKVVRSIREEHGLRILFDDGTETNVSLRSRKRKQ